MYNSTHTISDIWDNKKNTLHFFLKVNNTTSKEQKNLKTTKQKQKHMHQSCVPLGSKIASVPNKNMTKEPKSQISAHLVEVQWN